MWFANADYVFLRASTRFAKLRTVKMAVLFIISAGVDVKGESPDLSLKKKEIFFYIIFVS